MLQKTRTLVLDLQYFPSVNWFKDSIHLNQFCFYPHAPFRKSGFQNRLLIPASGKIVSLSIPLAGGRDVRSSYKAVEIDYQQQWQRDHFRSIDTAFGSAPFYFQYRDELKKLYEFRHPLLYNWNLHCLGWLMEKIRLTLPIIEQDQKENNLTGLSLLEDKYKPSNYVNDENGPFVKYTQVFEDRIGFHPNLSILDLLFNVGPQKTIFLLRN